MRPLDMGAVGSEQDLAEVEGSALRPPLMPACPKSGSCAYPRRQTLWPTRRAGSLPPT